MSSAPATTSDLLPALFAALPVAVSVYDGDHRLVLASDASFHWHGLEPSVAPPGIRLPEMVRILAWNGAYGPGDPEQITRTVLAMDRSRPSSRLVRSKAGRVGLTESRPLPGGGFLTCTTDVTTLSRAESESAARARLLEVVLTRLQAGVAVFDGGMQLAISNPAYEGLIGLSSGGIRSGMTHHDILQLLVERGEMDRDEATETAERMALGRFQPGSRQRLRPNGDVLRVGSQPLPSGGFMIEVDDVTALKRAEHEASRRAALLDGVLDALPHGVCVFGPDRRVGLFNRAYSTIMAGAPIEVGLHLEDLVARRVAEGEFTEAEAALVRRRPGETGSDGLLRHIRPNGTAVESRVAPLPDGGHIAVVTDVTALHRAEGEAVRRAEMLEAMQGSIRQGISMYGPDHRLLITNSRTEAMIGLPPGFLKPGRHVDEVLDEQVRNGEIPAEAAARARLNDRRKSYRYHRSTRDGRMMEIASDPMADGGFVMTFSDMTEEYRIRAELEAARAAAEAASEAKSRFLATMSHELRTPLNAVIGYSDALAGERDPKRLADYARSINEAGRHLLLLIDDILDVARSQTGALEITQAPIELSPLLAAAGAAVAEEAERAGLTLALEVPEGLPSLMGDAGRLHQLLVNLLSNAAKFTPAGGRITLSAKVTEAGLAIRVTDTGIGIAPEDRERVFEPFTQVDNSLSRRFHGSGLGLYMARTLAEALGGTVALEAPQGPGTVAVLRFPASALIDPPGAA
ncbi:PAS-domain containing protein [Falsiroseomonas sp.]|uniref:PAS-domain containing protein n=1 Tax=Falsiroseomonas sp. TaxID=2870721 RepID=UPI0027336899|nr:PAS-domain containing protein [Falsiroseomonas sp.]MDP3416790.1 PAS-domain containing protein [Falsiroseomonas sp.]